ncbi:MAG: hypothetical protein MRZ09_08255 [Coprobacillus sp.]|nr:hypothetical protein [Coprobacillus sp.]MDY4145633.1 hypothetical protein [Bacilli bacterium]CCY08191.1 putative uncharacterized protein [Coprobacillus sp. CAG:698]
MIQSKDYRAYVCDNKQLIDALKENNSVLISRLSDVFKVLDHIINLERLKKNISDELEVIFETGFSYIHEELEIIKIYYNNYFNKSITDLLAYENAINYLLYLEDLTEALSEKGKLTKELKQKLEEIINSLDKKIQNKELIDENVFEDYDFFIDTNVPTGDNIYTTDYIFSLILEEMGI